MKECKRVDKSIKWKNRLNEQDTTQKKNNNIKYGTYTHGMERGREGERKREINVYQCIIPAPYHLCAAITYEATEEKERTREMRERKTRQRAWRKQ